ncbi:MAG: aminotransferase class I/II-fold pyridoxal phosphate-dependent enzyme [Clostridiales Family XIII bacterium]|jgi:aspartate/methionine/tyrosine aminotransferase|nr:aminotransferase class I/II-fold pyridoxal phosphate-dependent enzyme [Clostridiales Family XIII bacterium]
MSEECSCVVNGRNYNELSTRDLQVLFSETEDKYNELKNLGLKLDLSRGKPGPDILAISEGYMDKVTTYKATDGTDIRNYGVLDGLPELKQLFSDLLDIPTDKMIVGGNASLSYMHFINVILALYGAVIDSDDGTVTTFSAPWSTSETKILFPVPGYDRHATICEDLGFTLIPVEMLGDGPDMDQVEALVANDASIKGIWCVPLYTNPEGKVYSEATAKRLAEMKTAAPDFRIFWDNAYAVHHIYEVHSAPDILRLCEAAGNKNRPYYFASTSKVTYPGAGVALFASSDDNIAQYKKHMNALTIGHDKFPQLRTVEYFHDADGIRSHMWRIAEVLRPKFDIVTCYLDRELGGTGVLNYTKPLGGYFVSVNVPDGCAKRVVALAKEAGVVLTGAGATWPYKKDPKDRNIRIAPSFPTLSDLKTTMDIFCVCVKLAALEQLLIIE